MDVKECIDIINYECIAVNGFLVKLRAREFSKENYANLMNALHCYRELIQGNELIDRSVAYCLHFLGLELVSSIESYPRTEEQTLFMNQVNLELSNLIEDILTPEHMKGQLPEEYL